MPILEPGEAVEKRQSSDVVESCDDDGFQRSTEVEYQVPVRRESIREEHFARAELMFGVMRPERSFSHWRRRNNCPVSSSYLLKVNHRQEVAVGTVVITRPREQI